jgi:hypothetical protein
MTWVHPYVGYGCPECGHSMPVARRADAPGCPQCLRREEMSPEQEADLPVEERARIALRRAGLDETDAATALDAVRPLLAVDGQ